MIDFRPEGDEIGERVDVVVARRSGAARRSVQQALKDGSVSVSDAAVRPSHRLSAGDRVRGVVADPAPAAPRAEDIPVTVRYSDARVLVVSKPAGLVTHPGHGHPGGTLVNALLALGGPLAARTTSRPGIVHRLDKDTSGLLLVARDDDALAHLRDALRARLIERRYLALVRGTMPATSGSVDAPVGRHPRRPRQRAVVPGGRPAVTHYRVLAAGSGTSLIDVALETGRTHQIRVHLGHLGHPVLGDRTYGGATEAAARLGLARPFLHAYRLRWPHPSGEGDIEVVDELPSDLVEALDRAGLGPAASDLVGSGP
ncbi:RluA family pseudouridine synthase [soil metagenome]